MYSDIQDPGRWLLPAALKELATRSPEAEWLVDSEGGRLSFGEAHAHSLRAAGFFERLGVRRGDRVGMFMFNDLGMQGAILQMLNHGLITGGLFLLVGVIYERTHDRTIAKMSGLAARTPVWAATLGFFMLASAGLPGLSGFVGEFLSLLGTFVVNPVAAAVATFCMILAAGYLLYMYGRIIFGEVSDFIVGLGGHVTDMTPTEILTLVPLATLIVLFGVQPGLLLKLVQGSVVDTMGAVRDGVPIAIGPEVVLIALGAIIVLVAARTFAVATAGRAERAVVAESGGAH